MGREVFEDLLHRIRQGDGRHRSGDESCPRSGRPEDDRLFRRWPPCGGALTPTRRIAPPTPPRAGPVRDPDILSGAEP